MEEIREQLHKRQAEFEEKYAEVIKHLGEKYNTPNAVDYLQAIARGIIYNVPNLYSVDIEYDEAGMVEDYKEIERLSKIINGDIVE